MFKATVIITLRPSILDPKGRACHQALYQLGLSSVSSVRMGKMIEMNIETTNEKEAYKIAKDACDKLLANNVMEDYVITLDKL
jgi:phosphoribosylformylglycinamidine synthase PurS subunit